MVEESQCLPPDEVRDAAEIARRALALFGFVGLALGAPREDIVAWLKRERLWAELSPSELAYVSATRPTKKQEIHASWNSERLIVLLWALEKVENLPAPNEQCDTALFQQHMPPFIDISASTFISTATRRPDDVLRGMADELLNLHWQARDAEINGRPMPPELDIEIIQERHHAINWVIGYDGLPYLRTRSSRRRCRRYAAPPIPSLRDATKPTPNGYMVEVGCSCGVVLMAAGDAGQRRVVRRRR